MRDSQLISIRPNLDLDTVQSAAAEQFQNQTLRPILKFQHPILVEIMRFGMQKHVKANQNLTKNQRDAFISQMVQVDNRLRRLLAGAIIGHFTLEEYAEFTKNEPENMRRLMAMMVERLKSVGA